MLYNNPPAYRVSIEHRRAAAARRRAEHRGRQGKRAGYRAASPTCINALRRSLRPVCRSRRCRARRPDARRQGLGVGPDQRLPAGIGRALSPRSMRGDLDDARARSIAGSCRCCTSMPSTIWSSRSSSPNRSWAAARERVRPPRYASDRRAPRRSHRDGREGRGDAADAGAAAKAALR